MTAPRFRQRLLIVGFGPEPLQPKERDAVALETLARLLELSVNPNPHGRFVAEPWETILRRYINDDYSRADKTGENELLARHFWLRQLVHKEKQYTSADEVLRINNVEKKHSTVLDFVKKSNPTGRAARNWIAQQLRRSRLEFTRDSIPHALLEHFEPGDGARFIAKLVESRRTPTE